jgi:hypothetical protein
MALVRLLTAEPKDKLDEEHTKKLEGPKPKKKPSKKGSKKSG